MRSKTAAIDPVRPAMRATSASCSAGQPRPALAQRAERWARLAGEHDALVARIAGRAGIAASSTASATSSCSCTAAIITPLNAAPAVVGSPLSATLPLNSGRAGRRCRGHVRHLGRVVADRHVAAVVVDPRAVGVLELGGDVVEGRHLVRREHVGVGQGDGLAEVEDVRRAIGALELVGGVDLVLAGAVGLVGVDLDVVLVVERLDDRRRSWPSPAAAR